MAKRLSVLLAFFLVLSLFSATFAESEVPEGMKIGAPSAILMDSASGEVLVEKNPDVKVAPASLTKIMTLVLAFDAIEDGRASLDDTVVTSENAASYGGTTIFLEVGEKMTLRDLLLGIAVASGNDASVAVAEYLGGSEEAFVHLMNEKAEDLGMTNTNFKNSHGLDEEDHYTTSRDLAILSRYATKLPGLLEMTSIYQEYLRDGATWLVNRNRLVHFYEGADGLKTGHTSKALYCLSATAKKGDLRLVTVVMGADTSDIRFQDTRALLNYGFANYESLPVVKKGDMLQRVTVWNGVQETIGAVAEEDCSLTIPKGKEVSVQQVVQVLPRVEAPLEKGDPLGELLIMRDGKEDTRIRLVASEAVPRVRTLPLMLRFLKSLWAYGR